MPQNQTIVNPPGSEQVDWPAVYKQESADPDFRSFTKQQKIDYFSAIDPELNSLKNVNGQDLREKYFDQGIAPYLTKEIDPYGPGSSPGIVSEIDAAVKENIPIELGRTLLGMQPAGAPVEMETGDVKMTVPKWEEGGKEYLENLGNAAYSMYKAHAQNLGKAKAYSEALKKDITEGQFKKAWNDWLGTFSWTAGSIPFVGPAMMHAADEIEKGQKIRGFANIAIQTVLAALPAPKKPTGGPLRVPELEAIGVTPTATEAMTGHAGNLARAVDPRVSGMLGAGNVMEPFLKRREAEIATNIEGAGKGISTLPKEEIPSKVKLMGAEATEEAGAAESAASSQAIPVDVTAPQGESIAFDAIRGNERAGKQVERQAWTGLNRDITARNVTIPTASLDEALGGAAALQQSARELIMQSVPPAVHTILQRVLNRGEVAEEFSFEDRAYIAEQTQNQRLSVPEIIRTNPQLARDLLRQRNEALGIAPPAAAGEVPFEVVHTARTGIGAALETARAAKKAGRPGASVAVHYLSVAYGQLSEMMRNSLREYEARSGAQQNLAGFENGGLLDRFDAANALTRTLRGRYSKPDLVRSIVYGERDQLNPLYKKLVNPGGKAFERSQVVNALSDSPAALNSFRTGLVDYVLRKASPEGVESVVDYNKALEMIREDKVPGVKNLFGAERYDRLVSALRDLKKNYNSVSNKEYKQFLSGVTGTFDARQAIRQIREVPSALDNAVRMAAGNPERQAQLAAGVLYSAVDDSMIVVTTGNREALSSAKLSVNLKQALPAIERLIGERNPAMVSRVKQIVAGLDKMSMQTGPKGISWAQLAQVYAGLRSVEALAGGRFKSSIAEAAFAAAPWMYVKSITSPRFARLVRDLPQGAAFTAGAAGKAAIALPKDWMLPHGKITLAPGEEEKEKPTSPGAVSAPIKTAPAKSQTYRVTKDGQTRSGEMTQEEVDLLKKSGFKVESIQ